MADIRENYRDAATSTETYVRVVAAAHARLTAELAKVDDKRVAAAELKYLPDALLAAELARAERAAVIEACTTTLERLAELPADSALDRATDPLRSLLLALQKVAQSAGGDGAD